MSWLAARKRSGKIVAWEYRWQERGLTRSRSTGSADLAIAKKVQKKWDAAFVMIGPDALEEKSVTDLGIESQVKLFLDNKAAEIRASTLLRYRQQIQHVLDYCKRLRIRFFDQLNSTIMKQYKIARSEAGAAPKTVFEELALLRAIIKTLVQEETIDADPVRAWPKIKRLPVKPDTLGCYTEEEMGALLDYFQKTDPEFYDVFLFAAYTGCRLGEIRLVKVSDVNLGAQMATVVNQKTGQNRFNATSQIRLPSILVERLRRVAAGSLPGAWLFPQMRIRAHDWARTRVVKACKKLGIQYRRFHGTRHTFITTGLNAGIPALYVQSQARHSRLSTTDGYAHGKMLPQKMADLIQFPRGAALREEKEGKL
jgi:integrase